MSQRTQINEHSNWKSFIIKTHFSFWKTYTFSNVEKVNCLLKSIKKKKNLNWENSCYRRECDRVFLVFPSTVHLKISVSVHARVQVYVCWN